MDILPYYIIAISAFIASLGTFFSGFGLGTILLPVFSLFFSLEIALVTTAFVHLINGIFKVPLTFKNVKWSVFLRFGVFAFLGTFVGSYLIKQTGDLGVFYSIEIFNHFNQVNFTSFFLGSMMLIFSFLEFSHLLKKTEISHSWIPVGGLVSGFFGGFSGHQGALRSAFLSNSGLSKFEFVATSALIGVMIDIIRMSTYYQNLDSEIPIELISIGASFAILGSITGNRMLKKTEMKNVKNIVGLFLFSIGTLMLLGFL